MDQDLRKQIFQGIFVIVVYGLASGLVIRFLKHF